MKTISTHTFKHTIKDIHKNTKNRKFCFVLGAGTSSKSGIPTGKELAETWFEEVKERLESSEFSNWTNENNIDLQDLAASYGNIYRKRFEIDKTSGYEFLVQAMKSAKPSFGHIILSQILSRVPGHCVLTTNFDSLVESSIYQFTNKTPLVCGHESLSGYARPSVEHPLVIKIHRDLLLNPKSDEEEINKLDLGWKEPLDHIFSSHIPVIIGYGGNDGSLMSYFETMNKPSNFFWCSRNENKTSQRIKELIKKQDGSFVKIEGFDELMHQLLWVFDEIGPIKDELVKITDSRIQLFSKQREEITTQYLKELSAFEYSNLAENETDFGKRKEIYLEAIKAYPNTGWLWWNFTYFLQFLKKDYNNLEEYYQRALILNSNEAGVIGNYAVYLHYVKHEYTNAEHYYIKTLDLDPNGYIFLANYAILLYAELKEYEKAENYYLKALSVNPNDFTANASYANYLKQIKKDYIKAEEYYLKAVDIDPNDATNNSNYALFLKDIKRDYNKSEILFIQSLEKDPNLPNTNINYAVFLKSIRKDYEKASLYYLKALDLKPKDVNFKGNYAQFLLEQNKIDDAKIFIENAFENFKNEQDLLIELWFYRYAHYPEYLIEAEMKIEELLNEGVRSIGWDFSGNIQVAIKNGHPNTEKLNDLAARISTP